MCDTLYRKTPDGYIFGKNSDRGPNEPNLALFYPRMEHKEKTLKCTYIEIEQVSKTHAFYLVRPSWMWGGEMGINEHGVVIGNEAVFTKGRDKKEERLLGMDLLRLALERAASATEAKEVIKDLLRRYGQGGNCGFDKKFYYDNSYLIADDNEAYVLETAGRDWAEMKIDSRYNISNRLSLNAGYSANGNLAAGFARKHSDFLYTRFSGSAQRERDACGYLDAKKFSLEAMMRALRHHHETNERKLYRKGSVKSVCMHASLLGDHTTGSMIVERSGERTSIWFTGCSSPCLSAFKPVYFPLVIPPVFTDPEESLSYWLRREYLTRAAFAGIIDASRLRESMRALEAEFIKEEAELFATAPDDAALRAFSEKCRRREEELVASFNAEAALRSSFDKLPPLWRRHTARLGKNVFARELSERKR